MHKSGRTEVTTGRGSAELDLAGRDVAALVDLLENMPFEPSGRASTPSRRNRRGGYTPPVSSVSMPMRRGAAGACWGVLIAALVTLLFGTTANAATVTYLPEHYTVYWDRLDFTAAPGEANDVTIDGFTEITGSSPRIVTIRDGTTPLQGEGAARPPHCVLLPGNGVCETAFHLEGEVRLGDQDDEVQITESGYQPGSFSEPTYFRFSLFGGPGKDTLLGGRQNDPLIAGGPGGDHLSGGPGHEEIRGGRGPDEIVANDGIIDRISCGPGRDRVIADRNRLMKDKIARDCELVTYDRTVLS